MKKLNDITPDVFAFIVSRLIENAKDAKVEETNDGSEFNGGKCLAYYEMLDTIKNELKLEDADLKEFGLDFKLESLL